MDHQQTEKPTLAPEQLAAIEAEKPHRRFNQIYAEEQALMLRKARDNGLMPNAKDYELPAMRRAIVTYVHEALTPADTQEKIRVPYTEEKQTKTKKTKETKNVEANTKRTSNQNELSGVSAS